MDQNSFEYFQHFYSILRTRIGHLDTYNEQNITWSLWGLVTSSISCRTKVALATSILIYI